MSTRRALAFASVLAAAGVGLASCGETGTQLPAPKPSITAFTSDRELVAPGETVHLHYAVSDATLVTLAAEGGPTFATRSDVLGTVISPVITAPTVFVLTAVGPGGSATQSLAIEIDLETVHVVSFTARPDVVTIGGMTTLSWSTSAAKSLRLMQGSSELLSDPSPTGTGELMVRIDAAAATFTLVAVNDTGMDSKMVTVTARSPVRVLAFKVRPQVFNGPSATVSVTWTAADATMLSLTANGAPVPGFDGLASTGTISAVVTDTTRFELTAEGVGGPIVVARIVGRGEGESEPNDTALTADPITSGVQAEITAGDVDFFSITVPEGGNVTAQISDGMGGCNFDSIIRLIDPSGALVTSDDDGGARENAGDGACAFLDPKLDAKLVDLRAGTYTLEVRGYDSMELGTYAMVVAVGPGICGNGFREKSRMEQCDDGNTMIGDGCSGSCAYEILGTVTQPGDQTFSAALRAKATAAYQVEVSAPTYVAIDTFAPTAGRCATADLVAAILAPDGRVIGADDDDGIGGCAAIHPARDPFARLAPGRYTVLILSGGGVAVPQIAVRIRTFDVGCGNGVEESGESCDDSNTAPGDGCDAACQIEIAGTAVGPPAVQTFDATIRAGGRVTYALVLDTPGYVLAETGAPVIGACTSSTADTVLTLTSSMGRELATNDDISATNRCSRIDPSTRTPPGPLLRSGHYRLTLAGYNAAVAVPAVQTRVRLVAAGCTNGILEVGEQCDDGNMLDGDGCSAMCRFDGGIVGEIEPNDTRAEATLLGDVVTATVIAGGGIQSMGTDVDVFAFDVTGTAGNLTARTYLRRAEPRSCAGDTELRLYDASGSLVAKNDDGVGTLCSEISGTVTGTAASALTPGRYYLRINEFGSNMSLSSYLFDVRLR